MILHSLTIEPGFILAPIAGFTDTYFRRMVKRIGGCGLVFSEMVSSEALTRGSKKSYKFMEFVSEEKPISIQISGANHIAMAQAARIAEAQGADAVDINMGCPAHSVVRSGAGSALINDPSRAAEVLKAVKDSVSIPVTVKIRGGWQSGDRKGIELARIAEECGASAVTVHARSRHDSFKEKAEWLLISEVKSFVRIPVIGNGDVMEPDDALRMMKETGCDAVMIGRGAIFNPWIFRQISQLLSEGVYEPATSMERKKFAVDYFQMVLGNEDERTALHRIRSFAGWYFKGMPGALHLRRSLNSIRSASEFFAISLEYLS